MSQIDEPAVQEVYNTGDAAVDTHAIDSSNDGPCRRSVPEPQRVRRCPNPNSGADPMRT
jgi:hypothetical protein